MEKQTQTFKPTQPGSATEKPLSGARILLAEDFPDNQLLMRLYLSGSGAQVDVANNGEEAVSKAKGGDYDIVLMDIQMPVKDGIQATRELRASGFQQPILALTAHAMSEEISRSLGAGCNAHLTKPITKPVLIEAVRSYMAKSKNAGPLG